MMTRMKLCGALVGAWLILGAAGVAQMTTTTVSDTVYHADGTPAQGSLFISWPQFTTLNGAAVAAGSTTVTLSSGGGLSVALAPNAGSNPIGSYYTVLYHLDDGSVARENWVVPASSSAVQLATVRSTVMPLSVAMQTVSKAYVDRAVASIPVGATASTLGTVKLAAGQTSTTLATVATTGSASDISTGTLADARLSSNVPRLAASNTFGSGTTQTVGTLVESGTTAPASGVADSFVTYQVGDIAILEARGSSPTDVGQIGIYAASSDGSILTNYVNFNASGATFLQPVVFPGSSGVDGSGNFHTSGRIAAQQATPGSSSAACSAGQMWTDTSYIYVCTAANTIKRAALSSF